MEGGQPKAELLAALGIPQDSRFVRMAGGSAAATWRLDLSSGSCALRVLAAEHLAALLLEAAAMGAARSAGLPAPEVLGLEVAGGVAGLLSSWRSGRTLAEALLEGRATPGDLGRRCGELQALLNTTAAPQGLVAVRHLSWQAPIPDEAAVLATVRDLREDRLLHLDFHPLNILTDSQDITGVVDWVNAGAGDPRQDLARSLTILRLDVPNVLASSPAAVAVLQSLEEPWVAGYEAVAGRQDDMATFLAWAGLRTLRDLAGKRSPDEFASMRADVEQWIVAAQKSRRGIGAP